MVFKNNTVGDCYQFGDSTLLFRTSWFSKTSRFFFCFKKKVGIRKDIQYKTGFEDELDQTKI